MLSHTHSHTHTNVSTHSWTFLHPSHFTLISAEAPVPEWVRPVVSVCQNRWTSAFCFSSQTNDLPSPCPSLPPAFIYSSITKPPPVYLPHCLGDISESKHPLLAWIAISCLVTSVFAFLTSVNPSHQEKGNYSWATWRFFVVSLSSNPFVSPSGFAVWSEASMASHTGTAAKLVEALGPWKGHFHTNRP